MNREPLFLEVDFDQRRKEGEYICGDSFLTRKTPGENRVVSVLSDDQHSTTGRPQEVVLAVPADHCAWRDHARRPEPVEVGRSHTLH